MIFRALFLAVAIAASIFAISPLSGCSKSAAPQPATLKSVDLGIVELSPNTPSRHDLGDGAVCVFTATPMDAERFELVAIVERGGKKVAATRVAPAMADQPLEISLANIRIGLVPSMK